MAEQPDKVHIWIVSIVAVVAIIAMVVLMKSSISTDENLAGQGFHENLKAYNQCKQNLEDSWDEYGNPDLTGDERDAHISNQCYWRTIR